VLDVTQAARLAGKERRCLGKLLKMHGIGRREAPLRRQSDAGCANTTADWPVQYPADRG